MEIFSKPEFAWLITAIIIFTVEALTVNLTTIWFGFGAIVSMIVAALGGSLQLQIIFFVATTILLLLFTRPIAVKYLKKVTTNTDSLIGKSGIVIEKIDNLNATGQVKIDGIIWSARSENGFIIEEHDVVEVCEIKGVKLIVKMKGM